MQTFDEWWERSTVRQLRFRDRNDYRACWEAAQKAQREKDAEIAESLGEVRVELCFTPAGFSTAGTRIRNTALHAAAAIREQEKQDGNV